MSKKKRPDLDIPVEFGGVSIGQATARLGLRISRNNLNINAADETFVGHRLTGKVILGKRDDSPGQEKMFNSDYEVEATFDVKRIGVSVDEISTGLTFNLADVDIRELAKFSKGSGKLVVYEVGEIPDDAPDDAPHTSDDGPKAKKSLKIDGDLSVVKKTPLSFLFKGKLLESLNDAGLSNIGHIIKFAKGKKKFSEIEGIGVGKADTIANVMVDFYADNPQAVEQENAAELETANA